MEPDHFCWGDKTFLTVLKVNLQNSYSGSQLTKCDGYCNTVDDPFGRICVLNKAGAENLKIFNLIKVINASKSLVKHTSWKCRCEFDGR